MLLEENCDSDCSTELNPELFGSCGEQRWKHEQDAATEELHPSDFRPAMPRRRSSRSTMKSTICFDERITVYEFMREDQDPEEPMNWKPKELYKIYSKTRKIAKKIAENQPEIVKSVQVASGLEADTKTFPMKQALAIIVRSGSRGVESMIEPALSEARVGAVRELLNAQEQYSHKSTDKTTMLLRSKSLKLSRSAKEFAWRVAQADAAEARKIHEARD